MACEFQVTQDSAHPHGLADWWAAVHNGALVWKEVAAIRHPEGLQRAPRVLFQLVPEGKPDEQRTGVGLGTSRGMGFRNWKTPQAKAVTNGVRTDEPSRTSHLRRP